MTYHQINTVIDQTKMSPEQLAPFFGVGSMTIRRWRKGSPTKKLEKAYQRTVVEGIYQLIIDGHLSAESKEVETILKSSGSLSFQAAIKDLGFAGVLGGKAIHQDKVTIALSQIGMNEKRKTKVEKSGVFLERMKKMGEAWKDVISKLVVVIRSGRLSTFDKLVAYGALFYLITPIDLIPDNIPVVGYIDDFAVLSFAVAYYVKKFPELFTEPFKDATQAGLPINPPKPNEA